MSLLAHFIPTHPKFADVFFYILRLGVQRVVWSGVTNMQEKRVFLFREFPNALDRVISEGIRRVVAVRKLRKVLIVVAKLPDTPPLVLGIALFGL